MTSKAMNAFGKNGTDKFGRNAGRHLVEPKDQKLTVAIHIFNQFPYSIDTQ